MSESINWTTTASVLGGPVVSSSGQVTADGYHKLEVALDAGTNRTLSVSPGNWSDLEFLSIVPTPGHHQLTYNSGTGDIPLPAPLVLIGSSAASLLGNGAATLTLKNNSPAAIAVDILVARNN